MSKASKLREQLKKRKVILDPKSNFNSFNNDAYDHFKNKIEADGMPQKDLDKKNVELDGKSRFLKSFIEKNKSNMSESEYSTYKSVLDGYDKNKQQVNNANKPFISLSSLTDNTKLKLNTGAVKSKIANDLANQQYAFDILSKYDEKTTVEDVNADIDKVNQEKEKLLYSGADKQAQEKSKLLENAPLSSKLFNADATHYSLKQAERDKVNTSGVDTSNFDTALENIDLYKKAMLSGSDTSDVSRKNRTALYNEYSVELERLKKERRSIEARIGDEYGEAHNQAKKELKAINKKIDDTEVLLNTYKRGGQEYLDNSQDYSKLEDYDTNSNPTVEPINKEALEKGLSSSNVINDKLGAYFEVINNYDEYKGFAIKDLGDNWYTDLLEEGQTRDWQELSENDIKTYYYIFNTEGRESAEKYLDNIQNVVSKRAYTKLEGKYKLKAVDKPVLTSLSSIPMSVLGSIYSTKENVNALFSDSYNPYSSYNALNNAAKTTRETVAKNIDEKTHNLNLLGFSVGDAYQAIMSAGDSIGSMLLLGKAGMLPLAGIAGTSRAKELYEQGASKEDIALGMTSSAIFEAVFERIGLDNLMKILSKNGIKSAGKFFASLFTQAGIEGAEEIGTEAANGLFDIATRGDNSDIVKQAQVYIDKGYTKEQAVSMVFSQRLYEAGMGGIVAGFASGGTVSTVSYSQNRNNTKKTGKTLLKTGEFARLFEVAEAVAPNNKVVGDLLNEIKSVPESTAESAKIARNVGDLYFETAQTVAKEYIKSNIDTKNLFTRNINKAIDVIYRASQGDKLNSRETETVRSLNAEKIVDTIKSSTFEQLANNVIKNQKLMNLAQTGSIENSVIAENTNEVANEVDTLDVADASNVMLDEVNNEETPQYQVSFDGHALDTTTDSVIDIAGFEKIAGDKIVLKTADGKTVDTKDVVYKDDVEAIAYETISGFEAEGRQIDADTANGLLREVKAETVPEAKLQLNAMKEAFRLGTIGTSVANSNLVSTDANDNIKTLNGIPVDILINANQYGFNLSKKYKAADEMVNKQVVELAKNERRVKNGIKGKVSFAQGEAVTMANASHIQKASVKVIKGLAKALNLDIEIFISPVNNKGQRIGKNGSFNIRNGKITIDLFAGTTGKGTSLFTLSHELVHDLRIKNIKGYNRLGDFLEQQYLEKGKSVDEIVKDYQNKLGLSYNEAYEEWVADSCEAMLTTAVEGNTGVLNQLKNKCYDIWLKLREVITKFAKIISKEYSNIKPDSEAGRFVADMDKATLKLMQEMYIEEIAKAGEASQYFDGIDDMLTFMEEHNISSEGTYLEQYQNKNTATEDGVRNSVRLDFADELQNWFDNNTTDERKVSGKRFLVGTTTDVLKSIGVKECDIYFGGSKINKILSDNESMTLDIIKKAVNLLEDPILILKSATVEDSIVLFGEVYTASNKPVMISMLYNPKTKSGDILDYAVITSAYGRRISNLQNLINSSTIYYICENKKRTDKWLKALGLQLPSALTKYGSINIISDSTEKSNSKIRDSRRITPEMDREYLTAVHNGDMETAQRMVDEAAEVAFVNSKIRDEDGKLLKVYHGTYEDFTVFDKTKGRTNMDIQGMFFSPWDIDAKGYGPNVRAFYLNITNPANENTGYKALRMFTRQNNTGVKAREYLESLGYDGVNNENEEFISFNPEQIKSADPVTYDDNGNVIPLSERFNEENEDIRYQTRPDVDDILFDDLDEDMTDIDAYLMGQYLSNDVETVTHLVNRTKNIEISDTKLNQVVSRLTKSYGLSDVHNKELAVAAMSLLESESQTDVKEGMELLNNTFEQAVKESTFPTDDEKALRNDILDYLREYRKTHSVYLSDAQISSLEFQGRNVNWLKKKLFGTVNIVNENTVTKNKKSSFADFYESLAQEFPQTFSMEDIDKVETWDIFVEKLDDVKNPKGMNTKEAFDKIESEFSKELTGRLIADIVENKYNSRKNAYVETLVKKLRNSHNTKVKKAKLETRKKVKEAERKRYEKKLDSIVEKNKEQKVKAIERRSKTETRHKIRKLADTFKKRLLSPTKGKYVPRPLISQTIDVLNLINLDTGRSVRLSKEIAALRNTYDAIKKDQQYFAAHDEVVSNMMNDLSTALGDTAIMDMSLEQLQFTYDTLRALDTVIRNSVEMVDTEYKQSVHEFGRQAAAETKDISKSSTSWFSKYLSTQMRPETFFEMIAGFKKDSNWSKLYKMLNDGQLHQIQLEMEFASLFSDLVSQSKQLKTLSDTKNLVDIGLSDENGNKIEVTRGMMLSVYMHLTNNDNARHIMRGGFTVPGIKEYYKGRMADAFGNKQRSARGASLNISKLNRQLADAEERLKYAENQKDIEAIENEIVDVGKKLANAEKHAEQYLFGLRSSIEKQLTPYEKEWLKTAHEFFDVASRNAINETSMKLYGFEKATVKNYYPIHTDSNYRAAAFENIVRDMSLENSGFMKNRIKGASNPILLEDITDVIDNQIHQVSKYCGMTIPVKNFEKVYGTTTAGFETSVQRELALKFSKDASKYIDNLMTDITTGRTESSTFGKVYNKIRGNLAGAVLSVNFRVAIAQAASYPTAAAEIGWKPLIKAFAKGGKNGRMLSRADIDLIAKWSPLLYHRMQGYSTTEIGDLKGERSTRNQAEKKMRWLLGWIQAVDGATVGRLWYAAEYFVQDNKTNLVKGTDAYYEEVAKVFNNIVERTQPNYTTMQRPDILRNPNALLKTLTMFMTQRLQNYNIMYSSAGKYRKYLSDYKLGKNDVTFEDVKEAKINLNRAVVSQTTAAVIIVAMKALSDILMHSMNRFRDDDDEITKESVSLALIDNFIDTVIGCMAFGSETYSTAKILYNKLFGDGKDYYYGVSINGVDSVTEVIDNLINVANEFSLKSCNDLAKSISQLFGFPLANIEKFGIAFYRHYQDIANGEFLSFESGVDRTQSQNANRFESYYEDGDTKKAKEIINEMVQDKVGSGKTEEEAKSSIRSAFTNKYKSDYLRLYVDEHDMTSANKIRQILYETGLYGNLTELDKDLAQWREKYSTK